MPYSLAASMEAYRATEESIQAWVEVNPQAALADGALNGLPFGVKDIIETAGMATEYGSALYSGRKGSYDADIVARLRRQGAILMGKTRTTAFAYFDPGPTRNPRNLLHTPGGSSSGSAAAVAAGVVPFAIGTQTMGSIVRPASFCGVVGLKPTFGALSTEGILPFAPSLDTVGFLAENVAVSMDVWRALGFEVGSHSGLGFGVLVGLPEVSPEMRTAFSKALNQIRRHVEVETIEFAHYAELLTAARTVNDYEGARTHKERWLQFGEQIGVKLADLIQCGLNIPDDDHSRCLRLLGATYSSLRAVFDSGLILLAPAALGPAPEGLASTGDPILNAVWTALGTPVLGLPMPADPCLPLGLQMIGARGADGVLLAAAAEVEKILID